MSWQRWAALAMWLLACVVAQPLPLGRFAVFVVCVVAAFYLLEEAVKAELTAKAREEFTRDALDRDGR